jgi:LysM repeat protein
LVWIANLYAISYTDLMAWNYLNNASVIYPGERLLLQVTPPATNTPTPIPATETPFPSPTLSPSLSPTATRLLPPTSTPTETSAAFHLAENPSNWLLLLAVAAIGVAAYLIIRAKKSKKPE